MGSGYSVEKQVTGKEDFGGVQLEIIPEQVALEFYLTRDMTSTPLYKDTTPSVFGMRDVRSILCDGS